MIFIILYNFRINYFRKMKLEEPINELKCTLKEIETRLMAYYPPVCKYDKQYKALNELRNRYINAIKLLEEHGNRSSKD